MKEDQFNIPCDMSFGFRKQIKLARELMVRVCNDDIKIIMGRKFYVNELQ